MREKINSRQIKFMYETIKFMLSTLSTNENHLEIKNRNRVDLLKKQLVLVFYLLKEKN